MASQRGWSELYWKHETWASSIPLTAWYFLGGYLVEDSSANYAVYAGIGVVSALRGVCWHIFGWETYLGVKPGTPEQYPAIDSPGAELPILTMPERLSVWLAPFGYLFVRAVEMEMALAHGFAGGIAFAIGTGIVYRRIRNAEMLFRVSDR